MSAHERDRLAIATIRERLEAAENAYDADAVGVDLADDVVLMVPDFAVLEGKTAAVDFLREMLTWMRAALDRHIRYVSAEVAVVGDIAFDRGTFSFVVSPKAGGDAETVTGKYLWLLTRDTGERWKVSRLMVSRDERSEECADEAIA